MDFNQSKKPDDGDYVLGQKWAPKFGERLLALFTAKVTQKTKFPMLFHKKDFPRKEDGTLNVKSWKEVVYEPGEEQIPDHVDIDTLAIEETDFYRSQISLEPYFKEQFFSLTKTRVNEEGNHTLIPSNKARLEVRYF